MPAPTQPVSGTGSLVMPKHAVGHADCDAFYVSAERVRDPFLLHKPVGVIGNQGACVIAKSYEMKAAGVRTGEPIWEAQAKCPDGAYVKRDFRWYEVLSRMMLEVVRDLSPRVEFYSIDEFFFDAEPPRGLDPQGYAVLIRDRVMERVYVPVTVGIARTRTLAKLICDTAKPFGALAVLDRARGGVAPCRPTDHRGLRDRRPASEAAGAVGYPHLPGACKSRPPACPPGADGHGRGVMVGTQRRAGGPHPPGAA